MGYLRQGQPPSLDRAAVTAVVTRFVADEIAHLMRIEDPFRIEHDCLNPAGHDFIAACGDVVCCHCGKVVWS
jgi:hypothetical protein